MRRQTAARWLLTSLLFVSGVVFFHLLSALFALAGPLESCAPRFVFSNHDSINIDSCGFVVSSVQLSSLLNDEQPR